MVDRDTRRTQPGQQYSSYRGRIESNILGVWWMCLAALQSERQVQLLAKVLNDKIDLIVSHVFPASVYTGNFRGFSSGFAAGLSSDAL